MSLSSSDRRALTDLVAFGREAEQVVARGRAAYDSDLLLQRAAQMICLNLGEAAKRLSPETIAAHPNIRFALMIALRDRVAHGYRILDPHLIWNTIEQAIPDDVAAVGTVLDDNAM